MIPKYLKKTVKVFEKQRNTYITFVSQTIPQFELAKFMGALPANGKILVIGSGTGRDVEYFAREGFVTVGIDISQIMLEDSKSRIPIRHSFLLRVNAANLAFKKESFDGIWCIGTFAHLKSALVHQSLSQCWSLLKKGGILCADVPVGEGEHWVKSIAVAKKKLFFSFWNQFEWEEALRSANFEFMSSYEMELDLEYIWIMSFAKKR